MNDANEFLRLSARLLLQYNMRSALLEKRLLQASQAVGLAAQVVTGYRQLTLHLDDGGSIHVQAPELRINVAVSAHVNRIIDDVCEKRLALAEGVALLAAIEHNAERHPRWMLVTLFGLAAMALAMLLSADLPAVVVIGLSSALGLIVRQEMAKRHVLPFALPFAAALVGSLAGGLLIRLGSTTTPGICLIVPALMLVPGPHFINALQDVVENNMHTGLARLMLALTVMLAAALGIFLGGWLTVGTSTVPPWVTAPDAIPLWADMLLAGFAACGFGAIYNAPWPVLRMSVVCGMIGHGIRYLCLRHGLGLEVSTLMACLAIGILAGRFVEPLRVPFAAVAFAAAVPMMPGVLMFRAIGGAMDISMAAGGADSRLIVTTLANAFTSCFVVGAMGVGLLLGARLQFPAMPGGRVPAIVRRLADIRLTFLR